MDSFGDNELHFSAKTFNSHESTVPGSEVTSNPVVNGQVDKTDPIHQLLRNPESMEKLASFVQSNPGFKDFLTGNSSGGVPQNPTGDPCALGLSKPAYPSQCPPPFRPIHSDDRFYNSCTPPGLQMAPPNRFRGSYPLNGPSRTPPPRFNNYSQRVATPPNVPARPNPPISAPPRGNWSPSAPVPPFGNQRHCTPTSPFGTQRPSFAFQPCFDPSMPLRNRTPVNSSAMSSDFRRPPMNDFRPRNGEFQLRPPFGFPNNRPRFDNNFNPRFTPHQLPFQQDPSGFSCDACNRSFWSKHKYEQHLEEHTTCPHPGCTFTAHEEIVEQHFSNTHARGIHLKLETPEEIAKWREDRRKQYPTKENIAKKLSEREARESRGEVLETKRYANCRERQMGPKTNDSSTAQNESTAPKRGFNRPFEKTKPLNSRQRYLSKFMRPEDAPKKPKVIEIEKDESSDSDSAPEEAPISSSAPEVKVTSVEQTTKTQPQISKLQSQPPRSEPQRRARKRKATLLEMLLAPDIRHERNILLQCMLYIEQQKFFGS